MNLKNIFTKKKVTSVAALVVALAMLLMATYADAADSKHWVCLVDDFVSSTSDDKKILENWEFDSIATKQVYVTSDPEDENADTTGYDSATTDYASVYVRVKLTQTLTIGDVDDVIIDPLANANSINQYPTYVDWTQTGTIKTIDNWIDEELQQQGAYWILDSDGWLYWAEPLEFLAETTHLLDTIELLVKPTEKIDYTVNVELQAVSSDLLSTANTEDYLGRFEDWEIADTAKIRSLFP